MRSHPSSAGKNRKWFIGAILIGALALGIFLHRVTTTNSWQETRCAVVGSRVVRSDVADSSSAIVMFKGEYELRYTVEGHEYSLWADLGWADASRQFVEAKVENLPEYCAFDIRYNPRKPSQAIATRK